MPVRGGEQSRRADARRGGDWLAEGGSTQAADAIVLDNSDMTMQQQMEWLKGVIAEKFGN